VLYKRSQCRRHVYICSRFSRVSILDPCHRTRKWRSCERFFFSSVLYAALSAGIALWFRTCSESFLICGCFLLPEPQVTSGGLFDTQRAQSVLHTYTHTHACAHNLKALKSVRERERDFGFFLLVVVRDLNIFSCKSCVIVGVCLCLGLALRHRHVPSVLSLLLLALRLCESSLGLALCFVHWIPRSPRPPLLSTSLCFYCMFGSCGSF
jgi:hypothetical protein